MQQCQSLTPACGEYPRGETALLGGRLRSFGARQDGLRVVVHRVRVGGAVALPSPVANLRGKQEGKFSR